MPRPPLPPRTFPEAPAPWLLGAVLVLAAGLRLFALDAPAMWWDEILVPMTASFPVGYILDFSRHCEMHPPLYYLLVKAVLAVGPSEAVLRLPSAAAGVAGIWVLHRFVRSLTGPVAALTAAAVFAWHPAMAALSRQVRPYALFLLAFLLSLVWAKRFLETGGRRELAFVALANAALLFLHYVAILLVPFQVLVVAGFWIARKKPWPRLAAYAAAAAGAFAAVCPFFLSLMARNKAGFTELAGHLAVARRIGGILAGFAAPGREPVLVAAVCLLVGCGVRTLWRRDRFACVLVAAVAVGPLAALVAARDDYVLYWHIAFVAPVLVLFAATGFAWVLERLRLPAAGQVAAVALVAVLGAGWLVAARGQTLFRNDDAAPLARNLAQALPEAPGALWCVPDMGLFNGMAWYLDRYRRPNPLRRQAYDAARVGQYYLVAATPEFFDKNPLDAPDATPGPALPGSRTLRGEIRPQGPFAVRDADRLFAFAMAPGHFYNQIDSLRDATLTRGLAWRAVPAAEATPARFAYRFVNETGAQGPVFVTLERENAGKGGEVRLTAALDGGPERLLAAEAGPVAGKRLAVRFSPPAPYRELRLGVGLLAGRETAAYPGGNLELSAVESVTAYFAEPGLLFDLMRPAALPEDVRLSGIEGLERGDGHAWRWVLGPTAELAFASETAGPAVLRLRFSNPIPDQGLTVSVNGRRAGGMAGLPFARWMEDQRTLDVPLALAAGVNRVELAFSRHACDPADPSATFSATDKRPLAMALTGCSLYAGDGR